MKFLPKALRARTVPEIAADYVRDHELSLLAAKAMVETHRTSLARAELEVQHHSRCIAVFSITAVNA